MVGDVVRMIERVLGVGALPADSADERLSKAILTGSAIFIATLSPAWYLTLFVADRPTSALIPMTYHLLTIAGIFAVVRRVEWFPTFRWSQQVMILVLPAVLQWTLGGFASSGAMILWGFAAALSAQIFSARPWPWMGAYVALLVVTAAIDPWLVGNVTQLSTSLSRAFFIMNLVGVATAVALVMRYFIGQRDAALRDLTDERSRSERLLLNVLPEPIAERLKAGESPIADACDEVTVVFGDIVGFTPLASGMTPASVVDLLSDVFTSLDRLAARHGLEKIKTIGDEYMAVGGVPEPLEGHADAAVGFALDALDVVRAKGLEMRFGIETGPVVAGVLGSSKFAYDLWGDTVNTASRMESHGVAGAVQMTSRSAAALTGPFEVEPQGEVEVKGKGFIETVLVRRAGGSTDASKAASGLVVE